MTDNKRYPPGPGEFGPAETHVWGEEEIVVLGLLRERARYREALETVSFHHDISDGALDYLREALDG